MDQNSSWHEPLEFRGRHIGVIGGGVLGRRVGKIKINITPELSLMRSATCWACAGYNVYIYDPDAAQCREAVEYFEGNKTIYQQYVSATPGQVLLAVDLTQAVSNAWYVVECVPENLDIKQKVFSDIESLCASDCILSTNSSSYRSSTISEKTGHTVRNRILNTHYFMPPHVRIVELMTNGHTAPNIFPFLKKRMEEAGLSVYIAKKESTGLIHNRVWAAIKRELLMVVSEGVADPKTADDLFFEAIVKPGTRPFVAMDRMFYMFHTFTFEDGTLML